MATRQKKSVISGVTRESADEAFSLYAQSDARIKKINADIELQCARIREKHQCELTQLVTSRERAFDVLQSFAIEQKSALFSKKKSLEMSHGTIGFRTGTPKLKTLKGFTWASSLNLVKCILPGSYVRCTEELAKDRLLSDRDLEHVSALIKGTNTDMTMDAAMAACGLQIVQDETFYVEPRTEESR